MPSAITFVISGNAQPFQNEMRKVEAIARTSAGNISSSMVSGHRQGMSGLIREAITIPREIIEGRGAGRIIGSTSLLISYLGNVIGKSKDAGGAAMAMAEQWDKLALKESLVGKEAVKAAQAMAWAKDLGSAAEQKLFNDLDREAKATIAAADAYRIKAEAQRDAAAIQAAEAAVSGGGGAGFFAMSIGPIVAIVGAIAAIAVVATVIYEKFWGIKNAIKEAGIETAKLGDDYVPLLESHITDAYHAQLALADAVRKTTQEYMSANAMAERQARFISDQFSYQSRLADLQRQTELAHARTPAQRQEIERRFGDQELQRKRDQHRYELQSMDTQKVRLEREKKREQDAHKTVLTSQEENALLKNQEINAKAGEAYLQGGGFWTEFKKNAAIMFGASDREETERIGSAIAAAEAGGTTTAQTNIQNYHDALDLNQEHNRTRQQNAEHEAGANRAQSDLTRLALQRADAARRFSNEESQDRILLNARLEMERVKAARERNPHENLNALQRIGGQRTAVGYLDSLHAQQETARNTRAMVSELRSFVSGAPVDNSGNTGISIVHM